MNRLVGLCSLAKPCLEGFLLLSLISKLQLVCPPVPQGLAPQVPQQCSQPAPQTNLHKLN